MFYRKRQYRSRKPARKQHFTRSKSYRKEEKLKLIKEFEALKAPMAMFCKWYGVGTPTFKRWQENYFKYGEQGLETRKAGRIPKEISDAVKTEIIKIKIENPGLGMKKISDWLARNRFVRVGPKAIRQVLSGNQQTAPLLEQAKLRQGNSGKEPHRFERSKPGEMYQMDIMTFMLQGLYRVYVIACLDDYSRFVVSIGLFRRQTTDRCMDVLRGAIERYGMPKEVLTDNGRQFYTWRGRSQFQKYLVKCGIEHFRSRPYHPQTLGKIESLWRNMYQELLGREPFNSFEAAEEGIKKWTEWYNFKRPHQGIGGLVPADRFFGVDKSMREVMEKGTGMVKDALIVDPRRIKEPVYLIGKIDGKEIRIIAKEGSVTLEGLDEVKENTLQEAKKDGIEAKSNEAIRQVAQEPEGEKKTGGTDADNSRKEKGETGGEGNESYEGGCVGVEK